MSGQKSKFNELDETITGKVKFGDGSTVEIKGKGSVSLSCKNGEERLLREVYFIPSLRSNIIRDNCPRSATKLYFMEST